MDDAPELNPYQSPGALPAPPIPATTETASKRLYLAWSAVFVLNLGVPLFFGWLMTEEGGRLGMFVAAVLLFIVGHCLCASVPRMARALIVGGVAIGLAQVFPLLQIMAGTAGFCLVEGIGLEDPASGLEGLTTEASGFVVALTTGGLLMAAAIAVGVSVRALFTARARR